MKKKNVFRNVRSSDLSFHTIIENLHHTYVATPQSLTSEGGHLPGIEAGQPRNVAAVATVSDFTGQVIEPNISNVNSSVFNNPLTGRWSWSYLASKLPVKQTLPQLECKIGRTFCTLHEGQLKAVIVTHQYFTWYVMRNRLDADADNFLFFVFFFSQSLHVRSI